MILFMAGGALWRIHVLPFVAGRSLRQIILAAGAVMLLASGLFGGLERAEPDKLETVKVGQTIDTGPFDLTVTKVGWAKQLGGEFRESEIGRYVVVYATVTSTEENTVDGFVIREALRIRGLDDFAVNVGTDDLVASEKADMNVVSVTDEARIDYLNPGLTYDVEYVWEQSDAKPLPSSIELTFYGHGFRQSNIDEQENWFDRFEVATGSFPVTELMP